MLRNEDDSRHPSRDGMLLTLGKADRCHEMSADQIVDRMLVHWNNIKKIGCIYFVVFHFSVVGLTVLN